jgi:Asp-tRNA(Asn)/Glu-tRNA(Gln) amidotransferase B subunit
MRDVSTALDMTGVVEEMKLSKGKANPQLAGEILERKLKN